jgi:hypothetical protein
LKKGVVAIEISTKMFETPVRSSGEIMMQLSTLALQEQKTDNKGSATISGRW